MPVALPGILSADDDYVYMRSQKFTRAGERVEVDAPTQNVRQQQGKGAHLFSPTGFLDDAYWHRSYWVFGQRWKSGAGGYFQAGRYAPAGHLLVFDDSTVYGYGRKPQYYKWTTAMERQLFACSRSPEIVRIRPADKRPGFAAARPVDLKIATRWTAEMPFYARAMVLADETLFVAGPPDIVNEEQTLKDFADAAVQTKLADQSRVLAGDKCRLWAVDVVDGAKLAAYDLPSQPVWDAMGAADGRLYIALKNGHVVCMARSR